MKTKNMINLLKDSSEVLVIYWNEWEREKYLVFFHDFHVLEDREISNMWTTGLVTRTWIFFLTRTLRWWLGLGGDDSDSDSDSEVMTRTRFLTIWTRTQHWCQLTMPIMGIDTGGSTIVSGCSIMYTILHFHAVMPFPLLIIIVIPPNVWFQT